MARINRKYSEAIEDLTKRPRHQIYNNKQLLFWKVAAYSGWIIALLSAL